MSDTDTNSDIPQCEYEKDDGEPCGRFVSNPKDRCFLHDEDTEIPDSHGAPKGNLNAATHFLYVSRNKMFEHMEPWEQINMLAVYEDLVERSVLDFECEYRVHQINCNDMDEDNRPPTNDQGFAFIEVPYPTEHEVRAHSLWSAAVDSFKMLRVSATLMEEDFTTMKPVASRYDRQKDEWYTIEEPHEHHLCLEYDRMIRRHKMMVRRGGVPVPS